MDYGKCQWGKKCLFNHPPRITDEKVTDDDVVDLIYQNLTQKCEQLIEYFKKEDLKNISLHTLKALAELKIEYTNPKEVLDLLLKKQQNYFDEWQSKLNGSTTPEENSPTKENQNIYEEQNQTEEDIIEVEDDEIIENVVKPVLKISKRNSAAITIQQCFRKYLNKKKTKSKPEEVAGTPEIHPTEPAQPIKMRATAPVFQPGKQMKICQTCIMSTDNPLHTSELHNHNVHYQSICTQKSSELIQNREKILNWLRLQPTRQIQLQMMPFSVQENDSRLVYDCNNLLQDLSDLVIRSWLYPVTINRKDHWVSFDDWLEENLLTCENLIDSISNFENQVQLLIQQQEQFYNPSGMYMMPYVQNYNYVNY